MSINYTSDKNQSEDEFMFSSVEDDELMFADEEEVSDVNADPKAFWKVLVVDDEKEVHRVTKLTLGDFNFEDKNLLLLTASNLEEAKKHIDEHNDIALILLDVIMEESDTGLKFVKYVREVKDNNSARIILRTGQAGFVPEDIVVANYEIDGFALKSDLTQQKLFTIVYTALRSYKNILKLESTLLLQKKAEEKLLELNDNLEGKVVERTIDLQMSNLELEKNKADLLRINQELYKYQDDLIQVNEELIDSKRVLEEQKRIVDQSARQKEQFLANMSHEIRTPINAIVGFTNLLMKTSLSKLQSRYLTNVEVSSENLLSIINDILDLSKIESGGLTIEVIDFSVHRLVERVCDMLRVNSNGKNLELLLHVKSDVPEYIKGDPVRLGQVLINLLSNAIKFTESGSVTLTLSMDNEQIRFDVQDTGIGIEDTKLELIFQKFTQSSSDTTRKYGGTGLGLAIAKKLVELHAGKIWVNTQIDKGSVFTFIIPHIEGSPVDEPIINYDNKNYSILENRNILLVDDNVLNVEMGKSILSFNVPSINVDVAVNGQEAIDRMIEKEYHLILMDMQMPVMDGLEAAKYIRTNFEGKKAKIPIIAVTANVLDKEKEKCFESGMDEYIAKPFKPEELLNKMALLLSL